MCASSMPFKNHSSGQMLVAVVLLTGKIQVTASVEAYQKCQVSKMKRFAKIANGWKLFTTFAKRSILDVWQGSEEKLEISIS